MSRVAQQLRRAVRAYRSGGEAALQVWVTSLALARETENIFCPKCSAERPHLAGICMRCWARAWGRPPPSDVAEASHGIQREICNGR